MVEVPIIFRPMSKTWTSEQYVSVIFLMKSRLSQEGCGRPSGLRRNHKTTI